MKYWMIWLGISTLLLINGCDGSTTRIDLNGPFGRHLPTSESTFNALGEAALELDRDQSPLRKLDVLEGDWTLTGDYQGWPGGPKTAISPICESRWRLFRRCLELKYVYDVPGETILELIFISWDPGSSQYRIQMYSSGWPLPSSGTGQWNETNDSLDFVIRTRNPATNKEIKTLYRLWNIEDDSHTWSQCRTNDAGELEAFLMMNATRAPMP